jgi:protein-L-isoaspartate(D-aspartate) O-methyltransferase
MAMDGPMTLAKPTSSSCLPARRTRVPLWLDRLTPGGRLLMPLTDDDRGGFLLLAAGTGSDLFEATSIGGVGIFHCIGARDAEAAKRLLDTLRERRTSGRAEIPIAAMHRGDAGPDEMERVWYAAPGFWLEWKAR